VRQQRLTDKQWGKSIDKMRNWGAPTAPSDIEPLVSYLTAAYSRDSGRYVPESISAEAAAALFEPLPDGALAGGDRERGLALYQDRCLPCHAEEGRGGPDAVALAGRHVLDRAPEFLEVIRGGRGRMPPAGDTTEKEAADLLAYLRSLP
jgi:mono/diheme cytochrome c family protein